MSVDLLKIQTINSVRKNSPRAKWSFQFHIKKLKKSLFFYIQAVNTFFQDNCTFLWLLKEVFAENQFNSKQIIFDLKKKIFHWRWIFEHSWKIWKCRLHY